MNKKQKEKAFEKAEELGKNASEKDYSEIEEKLPLMKRGPVKKIWDKVLFLKEKITSPEIPTRLKIVIVGALLYLILPIDVLPDTIPGLGLLDDVSVLLIVFREVSKFALPKIEQKIEQKFYDSCYQKIDAKLNEVFYQTLVNSVWTFITNLLGCLTLIFKPFGEKYSRYVAIGIFAVAFVYALVNIILYLKKYGKITKDISLSILKKKSISKGISEFVKTEYKYINYIYTGVEIAQIIIPEIPDIPDLPEIIKTFEKHYKKRIIIFVVTLAMYTALITATKFLLIR